MRFRIPDAALHAVPPLTTARRGNTFILRLFAGRHFLAQTRTAATALCSLQFMRRDKTRPRLQRFRPLSLVTGLVIGALLTSVFYTLRTPVHFFQKDAVGVEGWEVGPRALNYEPLGPEFTYEPWWEQYTANRTLYVMPAAGTCNVLSTVASALNYAYRNRVNVRFVFRKVMLWHHLFSFPPIPDSHAFPDGSRSLDKTTSCEFPLQQEPWGHLDQTEAFRWGQDPRGTGEIGCMEVCCWREAPYPSGAIWFYRVLRPASHLEDLINTFKAQNEWSEYTMVGVHIRRSDNFENLSNYLRKLNRLNTTLDYFDPTSMDTVLPLENYASRMESLLQTRERHVRGNYEGLKPIRFFLASDNDTATAFVRSRFEEDLVVMFPRDVETITIRESRWGVQLGVIDLFLLAGCEILIGTPFSSFTDTAGYIGGVARLDPMFGLNATTMARREG